MENSNMKHRRVLRLLILTVAVIALVWFNWYLFGPEYPSYKHELCTSTADYMKVNKYVTELMQTEYTDFFPETLYSPESANYYYDYSCNDRELHFTLYLEQGFSTEKQFEDEAARLGGIPHKGEKSNGDVRYIIFDMPCEDEIRMYLKEQEGYIAWDFTFSSARLDSVKKEVRYLLSFEYDNTEKKDVTVQYLQTYLKDIGTAQ